MGVEVEGYEVLEGGGEVTRAPGLLVGGEEKARALEVAQLADLSTENPRLKLRLSAL